MLLLGLLLISVVALGDTANILAMFPLSIRSHQYLAQAVIKEIALQGHYVTFYTSLPALKNVTNIKEIEVKDPLADFMSKELDFNFIRKSCDIPYFRIPSVWFMGLLVAYQSFREPKIQELIHSDEKYDLVLLETAFFQEGFIAFGHKFKAPVVSLHTFSTFFNTDLHLGNPFGVAYRPMYDLDYTDDMAFLERVHNSLRMFIYFSGTYTFYLPLQQFLMSWYFTYDGSNTMPSINDMLLDISLVFVNTQISVDYPRPWVPNVISIGGIHISPDRQSLPKDLKEVMDTSKNGVIYFSFGTFVPIDQMPDDMKEAFVQAFSKLKQTVLWKVNVDHFPKLPSNVWAQKWFPQQDVLAHPNCVAFITHGGLLSQEEALYFGVPLISVPFIGDQHLNTNRAVKRGFAINLNQYNITEKSVLWALSEILNNPSYRLNAKKYSKVFHDNPKTPRETLIYWIDYILRHKGAPFLRSEGRRLPFYKYLLLDVNIFLGVVLLFIIIFTFKLFKFTFCKVMSSHKSKRSHDDINKKK